MFLIGWTGPRHNAPVAPLGLWAWIGDRRCYTPAAPLGLWGFGNRPYEISASRLQRAFRLVQDIDDRWETGYGVYYKRKKAAQRGGFGVEVDGK